uniref:Protein F09G8.5 n=1 Tax=Haemonchus contortus TaxID=6289 RepID=A0A7I4YGW5_HAECO
MLQNVHPCGQRLATLSGEVLDQPLLDIHSNAVLLRNYKYHSNYSNYNHVIKEKLLCNLGNSYSKLKKMYGAVESEESDFLRRQSCSMHSKNGLKWRSYRQRSGTI